MLFFFYSPADGGKYSFHLTIQRVSYFLCAFCVNLTRLYAQSSAIVAGGILHFPW